MIRCGCGHTFTPSAKTFIGAQVFAGVQYALIFNCPALLSDGTRCASSHGVVMWESAEVGIHFGEIEEEDDQEMLLAAE